MRFEKNSKVAMADATVQMSPSVAPMLGDWRRPAFDLEPAAFVYTRTHWYNARRLPAMAEGCRDRRKSSEMFSRFCPTVLRFWILFGFWILDIDIYISGV